MQIYSIIFILYVANSLDDSLRIFLDYLPGMRFFRVYHDNDSFVEDSGMIYKIGDENLQPVSYGNQFSWEIVYDNHISKSIMTVKCNIENFTKNVEAFLLIGIDTQSVFGSILHTDQLPIEPFYLVYANQVILASSTPELLGDSIENMWISELMLPVRKTDTW